MPSYDGNRVVSWDDCVWQPKEYRNKLTQEKIDALLELGREIRQVNEAIVRNRPGRPLTQDQIRQLRNRGYG